MSTLRLRRLGADYERVKHYVLNQPRVRLIQVQGDPPERYQFEFRITSLRQKDGELVKVDTHLVEVHLTAGYPRTAPVCRMLTPVFHPNIAPHAICIGDHWSAGESLSNLVSRIGEMLAYQSYNTKSPLNGEAARWTEQHLDQLPLDPVKMAVESSETLAVTVTPVSVPSPPPAPADDRAPAPAPAAAPASAPAAQWHVQCPACTATLRLTLAHSGKRTRCPNCKHIFTPAAGS